jgi:HAD superfamily hydrolase (TIGR01509 family)
VMRTTRVAIAFFFFADGLLIGTWASRIPAIRHHAHLTDAKLGLALFAMSLGALAAMPLAGWLGERIGSRVVTITSTIGAAGAVAAASFAGGLAELAATLVFFGAGFGGINVAANAQGLALERRYGRSILASFHAAFSAGGLAGAGLGALAAGAGIGPRAHFAAICLAIAAGSAAAGRGLLPPAPRAAVPGRIFVRPPRTLLVLGAAAFATMLAEGAVADWSALYLSHSLAATAAVSALGYTGFSLMMATSRTLGDRLNERFGPVALARGGGLLAAVGLAAALLLGTAPAALAGFAAMGAGLGVVVPVVFRAAGSHPAVAPGVGLAAVSTIGWLGFLAGPPAIGLVAGAVGLGKALGIVVAATLAVALLARSTGPRADFRGLVLEPQAVLSDMDGVLVDSSAVIERTWRTFAARHGLEAEYVLAQSHGRRARDLIQLVAPHLDVDAEAARVAQEEIAAAGEVRALPGARELVDAIPPERFAVVTSSTRALAIARLNAAGLPVPDVLVTAEEVENGKPDPAGYLRAAELLGVDPAHCIVLEDAPAGVDAGRAAGMTVVAVLTTNDESALRRAHGRVPSLRWLLPGRAPLRPAAGFTCA